MRQNYLCVSVPLLDLWVSAIGQYAWEKGNINVYAQKKNTTADTEVVTPTFI